MTESADFKVRVIDDSTKQALKIQASIKGVESQLRSLDRAAAQVRGPQALKKFDLRQERGSLVAQRRALAVQTRMQDVAAKKRAAATSKADGGGDALSMISGGGGLLGAFATGGAVGAGIAAVQSLAQIALSAARAVAEIGISFGRATFGAIEFAQGSRMAFSTLTGSAAMGAAEFDRVRKEAVVLGTDVQEHVGGMRRLLAARFDMPLAQELLRMGADLKIAGANVEKVNLAISQIKMKGVLQGEELTGQLAEAGVSADSVYRELGKTLGKTREEILRMQKGGQIKADVAISAIMSSVKADLGIKNFGEKAKQAAQTQLRGMTTAFEGKVENMWVSIGDAIEAPVMSIAGKVFGLFDTITSNPKVRQLGDYLVGRFKAFASWTDQHWPQIEKAIVTGVEITAGALLLLGQTAQFTIDHFAPITTAVVDFHGAMFAAVVPIVAVGTQLVATGALIAAQIDTWKTAGANLVQGLIDGIMSKIEPLTSAIEWVADKAAAVVPTRWQEHSPSKLFAGYGEHAVEGLAIGFDANKSVITGATAGIAGAATSAMEGGFDAAPVGGGGGSHIEVSIGDINVTVGPGADGQQIGIDISRAVRRELRAALEEVEAA